jgi:hypothetical protein
VSLSFARIVRNLVSLYILGLPRMLYAHGCYDNYTLLAALTCSKNCLLRTTFSQYDSWSEWLLHSCSSHLTVAFHETKDQELRVRIQHTAIFSTAAFTECITPL